MIEGSECGVKLCKYKHKSKATGVMFLNNCLLKLWHLNTIFVKIKYQMIELVEDEARQMLHNAFIILVKYST